MTSIHGIAYLIIGSLVTGFSYYFDNKNNNNSFMLFFYLGIIFFIIGIIKLISKYIERKSHRKEKYTPSHHTIQHQNRFCGNCSASLKHNDHFCPQCGHAVYSLR